MAVKMEREIRCVHVLRLNRITTVAPATDREIQRQRERGGGRDQESEVKYDEFYCEVKR